MSKIWMESERPAIAHVIPMTPEAVTIFGRFYDEHQHGLDVEALERVLERDDIRFFGGLTPPDNPLIMIDEETGAEMAYQVWIGPPHMGHRPAGYEHIPSPDFTTVLVSRRDVNEHGESQFVPQMLLRGKNADSIIIGGMTCCDAVGIQTHWTQILPDGRKIDEGLIPLDGLKHEEHAFWLTGKVYVAPTEELLHILLHAMAHCFPNSPHYAHSCESEGNIRALIASHTHASPR